MNNKTGLSLKYWTYGFKGLTEYILLFGEENHYRNLGKFCRNLKKEQKLNIKPFFLDDNIITQSCFLA